jgi:hypothetical protein
LVYSNICSNICLNGIELVSLELDADDLLKPCAALAYSCCLS